MWKLDLKDVYFLIPLSEDAKGYVRFYWEGNFYQFLFLYWIETVIIIYLHDMLMMGKSVKERLNFRDTVILLL